MGRDYRCLNGDWKFIFSKMPDDRVFRKEYDDSWWELVQLPHTPRIEPYDVLVPTQGQCWYRKHIFLEEDLQDKKLFLEFEGAMQECDVWINGKKLYSHYGGYLPFTVDITGEVTCGQDNVIAVYLQNLDDPDIPPGKSSQKLDFQYWGGLYRNVRLCICDRLHITDPVYKNKTADGGVFVRCESTDETLARLLVTVNVDNEQTTGQEFSLQVTVHDRDGNAVASERKTVFMEPGDNRTERFDLTVKNPKLWSVDTPHLYELKVSILRDQMVDEMTVPVGIRWLEITPDGLFLNGKRVELTGANRHQQYPHLGIAVSDEAHYREMKLLKEGGFNLLRLCHYPQAPAVYRACDELGILVINCTPGWQWCKESGPFKGRAYQNIRDMVRRDRNHPCVVMWEVSLNETGASKEDMWNDTWSGADDDFMHNCHLIAHEEYPGSQMYTSGDSLGRVDPEFVNFDVPYTCGGTPYLKNEKPCTDKPFFCREYGDFGFGFHFSTTRRDRGDGEHAMLHAAWNFAYTHNKLRRNQSVIGDAIWVGIDYTRPYFIPAPICKAGVLDIFRIPKFGYHFFASQRDDRPVLYIANYWKPGNGEKNVVVFSNCEEVALFVNGKEVGRRKAAGGEFTPYQMPKKYQDPGYWKGNARNMLDASLEITAAYNRDVETHCFDGTNSMNLPHPPVRFDSIPYEDGELRAVGYVDGREVVSQARKSHPKAEKLHIEVADFGIPLKADGTDFVFAYACMQDADGVLCAEDEREIQFIVEGGQLIGRNPVKAQAGIAPIMVRKEKGQELVRLTVYAEGNLMGECAF